MNISEPIELNLAPRAWVYRLWNTDADCLYVGQHRGLHPATRVKDHRDQPWWDEVVQADYVEVLDGDLDIAEKQQIHDLNARYNDGGWHRLHPPAPKVQVVIPADALAEEQHLVTVEEAAAYLGVSPWTVRRFCAQHGLPVIRLGRRMFYSKAALQEYFASSLRQVESA